LGSVMRLMFPRLAQIAHLPQVIGVVIDHVLDL
jgi:hypothetical protein